MLIFIVRLYFSFFFARLHVHSRAPSSVVHWPVAFAPGSGLFPEDPERPGYLKFDLETTLVETWKAMIALPKSKASVRHAVKV